MLERLRAEAPRIARSELVEGRAFFCWNDNERGGYFPMVCKADIQPNKGRVRCMCLKPGGEAGVYVVDPEFNGETGDEWSDHAMATLIFDARPVTGEVWRELEGGWGGERAWHVVRGE